MRGAIEGVLDNLLKKKENEEKFGGGKLWNTGKKRQEKPRENKENLWETKLIRKKPKLKKKRLAKRKEKERLKLGEKGN